jgi:hypothetical protein
MRASDIAVIEGEALGGELGTKAMGEAYLR